MESLFLEYTEPIISGDKQLNADKRVITRENFEKLINSKMNEAYYYGTRDGSIRTLRP
jgi:hypothetical protein